MHQLIYLSICLPNYIYIYIFTRTYGMSIYLDACIHTCKQHTSAKALGLPGFRAVRDLGHLGCMGRGRERERESMRAYSVHIIYNIHKYITMSISIFAFVQISIYIYVQTYIFMHMCTYTYTQTASQPSSQPNSADNTDESHPPFSTSLVS